MMDNKKAAIEWFSMLKKKFVKTEYEGYLDMAISALEKQEADRWIPVTERLPEEYGEYRITWKTSSDPGKRFIGDAEYEPGFEWDDAHDRFFGEWLLEDYVKAYPDVEVTAWKPIGEPYTEEDNDQP
jgi:hypothetical protein